MLRTPGLKPDALNAGEQLSGQYWDSVGWVQGGASITDRPATRLLAHEGHVWRPVTGNEFGDPADRSGSVLPVRAVRKQSPARRTAAPVAYDRCTPRSGH